MYVAWSLVMCQSLIECLCYYLDCDYKAKYERAVREFNFQSKKQKQQFDDEQEELTAEKKTLERKVK